MDKIQKNFDGKESGIYLNIFLTILEANIVKSGYPENSGSPL